jgi:hypothetical protein
MFKDCYHYPDRGTKTPYDLRPVYSQLAYLGICGWFATYYLMTDKPMNSLVHLEDIHAGLPNPSCFLDQGCLGGLTPSHYTHILRVHGFEAHEELRMTRSNEGDYLGVILRRMLKSGRLEPGAKFLLDVEQSHVIAVKILHGGKIVLVDQATSCFLHEMCTNQRFSKWYYCENFVLLRVLPAPGNPSSRLRAAVHEALEAEASMRRAARRVESALKVATDLRKHYSREHPRPQASRKFHPAYSKLLRMQTWLAIVKHRAGALKRLAEDAGAVFEPRRRARILPRAPGAGRRTGVGALQRLVLDRSRTARALAEREAAWAAQGGR